MIDPMCKEKIERLCASLEGTSDNASYKQKLLGLFPLSDEEQELMDEIVFQCPECGYWYRSNDMVEGLCEDCYEEEMAQLDGSDEDD